MVWIRDLSKPVTREPLNLILTINFELQHQPRRPTLKKKPKSVPTPTLPTLPRLNSSTLIPPPTTKPSTHSATIPSASATRNSHLDPLLSTKPHLAPTRATPYHILPPFIKTKPQSTCPSSTSQTSAHAFKMPPREDLWGQIVYLRFLQFVLLVPSIIIFYVSIILYCRRDYY